jgi:membrane protein YdbS with pleckstrin-like domain
MLRFRSKVDSWLVLLVVATGALAIAACAPMIRIGSGGAIAIAAGLVALVVGFPAWLLSATHYTLEEQALKIRGGPFRWTIPYRDITDVKPSRSPLSSPALSLDRLRIEYGGKSIMISPVDRASFIQELDSRRAGNRLQ